MRLEGQCQGWAAVCAAHFHGCGDHRPMPEMYAVEIAHGDHRPPGNLDGGRGVADNGKMRSHQGNSRTEPGWPDRGLTPRTKSSRRCGRIAQHFHSFPARSINALFNALML